MQIKRILLLGASGQIGKELSIHLQKNNSINLTCVVRNKVSAAFFKRNNINFLVAELRDSLMKKVINESDLIFELSAPLTGSLYETKKFYKERIDIIANNIRTDCKFVFASSMNALGYSLNYPVLKNYFLPRTLYAANKRFAEKYICKLSKKYKFKYYNIRLTEVHGHFQKASENIKKLILLENTFVIPKTPAYVTFISTVNEMLINILNEKELPGTYYLLTKENIYWNDLLNYLGKKVNKEVKYIFKEEKSNLNIFRYFFQQIVLKYKDLFLAIIPFSENFLEEVKLNFRINKVKTYMKHGKEKKQYTGLSRLTGIISGPRINSIKETNEEIFKKN
jgi:nucleoside-diphosphate-sugar epimerase